MGTTGELVFSDFLHLEIGGRSLASNEMSFTPAFYSVPQKVQHTQMIHRKHSQN